MPSINDKTIVEINDDVRKWYNDGLKTVRTDYAHLEIMPEANSIRPAAAVAIIKNNEILMLKRADNNKWTLPGGTLELNESMIACAVREVKEETALEVEIKDVIGTFTDPKIRVEYSDGEVRREFTVVYYGECSGSAIAIDNESTVYKWIKINEVMVYPMADSQKKRIEAVIDYITNGKKRLG